MTRHLLTCVLVLLDGEPDTLAAFLCRVWGVPSKFLMSKSTASSLFVCGDPSISMTVTSLSVLFAPATGVFRLGLGFSSIREYKYSKLYY